MPKDKMIPLPTQEIFESLYDPAPSQAKLEKPVLVYYTANWCGACKRLDWDFLLEEFPDLTVYKCDVDENKYTGGFCGVKSIPNFVMVHPGKRNLTGPFQSSDTAKVATWILTTLRNPKK